VSQKKLVLDTSAMQEDFFDDVVLIGLATAYSGHRFCWLLNSRFNLDFKRAPEMDVCLRAKREEDHQHFSVYQYIEEVSGTEYLLYRLRCGKQNLLPEIKSLDYLWLLRGSQCEEAATLYSTYLRDMPEVQLARLLSPQELKNRGNLLV
jgi:hypothetical protein